VVASSPVPIDPSTRGNESNVVPPVIRREIFELAAEEHKSALAVYAADSQKALESVRAANASGLEALKATTFVNGGAAVAMLAFVGHLASIHASSATISGFASPLRLFVLGVLLGVAATGVTYLTHGAYLAALRREFAGKEAENNEHEGLAVSHRKAAARWSRGGRVINFTVILLVIGSLFCFAYGSFTAYQAFQFGIQYENTDRGNDAL
jgi:hypothetical protein